MFRAVAAFCLAFGLLALASCDSNLDSARLLLEDLVAGDDASPLKARVRDVRHVAIDDLGDIYSAANPIRRLVLVRAWGVPLPDKVTATIAQSLARSGFEVLIPALPAELVPPADAATRLGACLAKWDQQPSTASNGGVIILASSLSGYAAIAAARARPDRVHGVMVFSLPYDLARTAQQLTKGDALHAPNQALVWQASASLIRQFVPPRDQGLALGYVARRAEGQEAIKPASLGPQAQAILMAVETGDWSKIPDMRALLSANRLEQGPANLPILALYARNDPVSPADEAILLSERLGLDRDCVLILDDLFGLAHGQAPSRSDRRLWLKTFGILISWRDGKE